MLKRTILSFCSVFFLFSCATPGSAQLPTIEIIENYSPQLQGSNSPVQVVEENPSQNNIESSSTIPKDTKLNSSLKHQGSVLCLERNPASNSFFSGGADGFVAEHNLTGNRSFWQISDIPVRKIAIHPEGDLIAVYESDGYSLHRVSVWNWKTKQRLYAKRFRDSIVSISWSAKGSWLIVGNTSLDGVAVFSSTTGENFKIFTQSPGIVSLAVTGDSETSMITYGPSGRIIYTDISSKTERAVFYSTPELQNPLLFSNNSKIAGFKDGELIVLDATTGKQIESFQTDNPTVLSQKNDTKLHWIDEKKSGLYSYRSIDGRTTDFNVPDKSSITSVLSEENFQIIGTSSGNLFSFEFDSTNSSSIHLTSLEIEGIKRIDDICSDDSRLFILSSGSVFISTGAGKAPVFSYDSVTGNHITFSDYGLLIWSNLENSPIVLRSLDGESQRTIYTVSEILKSVSVNKNLLSIVEGSSSVRVININTGEELYSYQGAGFQEALMINEKLLCISKSATLKSPNPILLVNTLTGETVPLALTGDLCYSLKQSKTDPYILGACLVRSGETKSTELISIKINPSIFSSTIIKTEAVYPDEDLTASVYASDANTYFTTIGKNSLIEINSETSKQYRFKRTFALPAKSTELDQFISCLNFDGSITWYNKETRRLLSTAYINEKGFWIEYSE